MSIKNAFYAQSGGVTSVINASACGVIETCRQHSDRIGAVFAGRNGIIGALTEELVDTSLESSADIAALRKTPSGAFGSCRFKMKSLEQNKREYERLIAVFKAHNIGYFFYNGGGDSADTCYKVSQLSEKWVTRYKLFTSLKRSITIYLLPITAQALAQSPST
jgi:6-phosphofructokinase